MNTDNIGAAKKGYSRFRIFLSLLLIISITIITIAVSIYSYFYNTTLSEINNSASLMMRQSLANAENRMDEVIQRTTWLVFDNYINGFIYSDENTCNQPQYIEMAFRISSAITTTMQQSDAIDSIYIFFKNSNIVLSDSGKFSRDDFFESKYISSVRKKLEMGPTSAYFVENRHYELEGGLPEYNYFKGNITSVVRPFYYAYKQGFIVINIRNDKLFGSMRTKNGVDTALSNFIIADRNNNIIYADEKDLAEKEDLLDKMNRAIASNKDGYYDSRIGNKRYLFVYTAAGRYGWRSISYIPFTELYKSIYIFRNVLSLLTLVIILLSVAASHVISRKIYKPVKSLYLSIKSIGENDKSDGKKRNNELDSIKYYIDRLSEENIKIHRRLTENIPLLKEVFLQQLMTGRVRDITNLDITDVFPDLTAENQRFAVYLVMIDKGSSFPHNTEMDYSTIKFAVYDSAIKAAGDNSWGMYIISESNMVVLLKGLTTGDYFGNINSRPVETAENIRKSILSDLKISVTISIGIIADNYKEIAYSYFSAREAINYRIIYGNGSIINSSEINRFAREKYLYPFEEERNLVLYINECSTDKVKETIGGIFKDFVRNNISYKFLQQLTIQLLNTIHRYLVENNIAIEDIFEDPNLYEELNKKETIDDMEKWFCRLCEKTISALKKKKELKDDALVCRILEYVGVNFSGNINLEIAADHFNMSRQYFSRYFTNHTGAKFNNYLNDLRLEKAKELLSDEKLTLNDICERTGFNSTQYFIKQFKSKYLVTPAQYREGTDL